MRRTPHWSERAVQWLLDHTDEDRPKKEKIGKRIVQYLADRLIANDVALWMCRLLLTNRNIGVASRIRLRGTLYVETPLNLIMGVTIEGSAVVDNPAIAIPPDHPAAHLDKPGRW